MEDLDTKRLTVALRQQRESILDAWEQRVVRAEAIPSARALPRHELRGSIGWVLDTALRDTRREAQLLVGVARVHANGRREAHYTLEETRAELEELRVAIASAAEDGAEASLDPIQDAIALAITAVDEVFSASAARLERARSAYSAARLLDAFAKVPAHVAVLDGPDHVYAFLNDAFRASNGVPNAVGKPFGASNHPAVAPVRAAIERVYRTGEPWAMRELLTAGVGKNGEDLYFDVNVSALRGEGNAIDAVLLHSWDVTSLVCARHALRESEEKLRMAVDAAGIGLWSWEVRTDQVEWGDALSTIFGLAPGAAPKDRSAYLALIHPEDRSRHAEVITRGVAAGAWDDEFRILRADGAVRWVLTKARASGEEGRRTVLGSVIDVTDRHYRDEQLRTAQRLEAIGQLTAGIAHNFNNMLMGVLPNLSLSLRSAPPALVPLLRDAERATERAAELVRQLMTYAGRNRPAARRVESLAALVERTLAIGRTTFDRSIAFETRYDVKARARVDAAQIEQATLNILINARDALAEHRPDPPRVSVGVDVVRARPPELGLALGAELHESEYARITIGDNGIGMDAATLARIYEPFFTTKEVGRGTGLGLATAHSIVRENGGWMTCASSPGEGATFTIYLPSEGAEPSIAPKSLAPLPDGGTETVLVIDDEVSIRRVVALMLEPVGYTVKAAASGEEAVQLLGDAGVASEVALILLDVSMPGMPGREVRRRLGELAPHASVVYFTGHGFEGSAEGDLMLEKPVTQPRLLATVRDVLDRKR